MQHHTENEERANNLSFLAVSGPGEFFRVEANDAVVSTPGGHQQNETCTCYKREARRLQQNTTCPCDCLDLLPLSHDGLGHTLSEVKNKNPVLALLSRLDSVCQVLNMATSQGWQYDVDCWEVWARPPVLTPVPSQANHSSHGHVERLKHDPRHALLAQTGYS